MKKPNIFFCHSESQKNLDEYLLDEIYKGGEIKTFFIEGKKCIDKQALYMEFSEVLSFPGYFGKNWDAFEGCINDLEWLQEKVVVLSILNCDRLLDFISEERDKQVFWNIIKTIVWMFPEEKYSNPVDADEPRVVFVLQSSNKEFLNNMFQYMVQA